METATVAWKRHQDGSYTTGKIVGKIWGLLMKGNPERNQYKTLWYVWVRRFEKNGQVHRLSLDIGYSTLQAAKVAAESEMLLWQ